MPKFILKISTEETENLLEDDNIGCFIFSSSLPEEYLQKQISRAQKTDKIVLLEGNEAVARCLRLGADGIVADLSADENIKKTMTVLRQKIGNRFLGVVCRCRRHEAMLVSENEPDFVIFKIWHDGAEKTRELTDWYTEFFLIQMAVAPQDRQTDFTSYRCDLVILSPADYKILVAKK